MRGWPNHPHVADWRTHTRSPASDPCSVSTDCSASLVRGSSPWCGGEKTICGTCGAKACGRGPWIGISREEDDELVVVIASECRADGEDQSRRWRAAGWGREEAGAAPLDGGGEGSDRAGDGAHRSGDARDRAAARCAREHAEAVACAVSSG